MTTAKLALAVLPETIASRQGDLIKGKTIGVDSTRLEANAGVNRESFSIVWLPSLDAFRTFVAKGAELGIPFVGWFDRSRNVSDLSISTSAV